MIKEMYYWMMYFLKKIGRTDMLEFNSYLLICMLLSFNIMMFCIICCSILEIDIKSLIVDYKVTGIGLGLSIMIPNYFFLFAKRNEIIEKYDQMQQKRRTKGIILFWIYSIVSIPLFFILVANLAR
ncbi:MAG: hypothetical protein PHV20_01840 [Bacteroidales bacterium]|nr:hypothetical protein [Bacteroidales bacterium]